MRRREFIALLGGAATTFPLAARAQQSGVPVIGFLSGTSLTDIPHLIAAFQRGLRNSGFVEGQNVAIEYRTAQDRYDQLPALAADLVRRRVAVIVALGPPTALAAKAASTTIPIVFTSGGDVVKSGLVASLNRPGGNATGVNLFTQAVEAKKLEFLVKLVPSSATVGFLVNPDNSAAEGRTKELQEAARGLGHKLQVAPARNEREIDTAFASLVQRQVNSLVVAGDPSFDNTRRTQIVGLAARHSMPTIYGQREYVMDGGLISYGTSLADAYRQVGSYVGSILKGAKPADLPVLQPTRFEFVINIKTAKMLRLDIPPTLLAIADEVIE